MPGGGTDEVAEAKNRAASEKRRKSMLESQDMRIAPEKQRSDAEESWEAGWEDWWRSDRMDAVGWAALFLWGALVVVAENTSIRDNFDWWGGWGVFWVGAGVIVLVEAVFRTAMPRYRSKWGWTLFWGAAFLAFGLGELASPVWYALPLVAIAVIILSGAFARNPDEHDDGWRPTR
jgi:hypothetical protein